jgi:hypothetical protein
MDFDLIMEFFYHASGILVVLFLLAVTFLLKNERKEIIKSRLFLSYDKFKVAFYVAVMGGLFFLIGNILGVFDNIILHKFHDLSEIVFNLCLAIFICMIYLILRKNGLKGEWNVRK